MRKTQKTSHATGLAAEQLAMWYLRLRGYTVVWHRYKTAYGEIDIIAQKQQALFFIEVKQRASLNDAAYAITPRNQQRIANTAACFLAEQLPDHTGDVFFDALLMTPCHMQHVASAWCV